MHLAINACHIDHRPSGAKHRFIGLYHHLFALAEADRFTVFQAEGVDLRRYFETGQNVEFVPTPLPSDRTVSRSLKGYAYWRGALRARRPDVFETAYFPAVIHAAGATVLTVPDNRYLFHPERHSALRRLVARRLIGAGVERVDLVVTISEAMRAEILEVFPHARVEVVGCGLPRELEIPRPPDVALAKTREAYRLPSTFLLSVGHLEKRKNFLNLLRARALLARRGHDLPLVIVGRAADDQATLQAFIAAEGVGDRVRLISDVSFEDLAGLYAMAALFVFPSIYEGFGIPLLEAMHFECPYVVSNLAVFREITAGRAHYFEPTQPEDMALQMCAVLESSERRRELVELGRERLQVYDYRTLALAYAGILKALRP